MTLRAIYTVFLAALTIQGLSAQDLHFTNYDFAPLYLNPAQTGAFYGTIRLNGIAREQFASFINEPYQTAMVSVEGNLDFAARSQDWSGVGLTVFGDQVGEISLKTAGVMLSYAYHLSLDKKQKNVLTASIQQGFFQKSIDNNWRPEDLILNAAGSGGSTSADQEYFENDFNGASGNSTNAGLLFKSQVNKKTNFSIGAAMYSIIQPRANAGGANQRANVNQPARRFSTHANLINQLSKKLALEYAVFYSNAAKVNNTMLQVKSHINLSKTIKEKGKRTTLERGQLTLGLGYRVDDALQLITAYMYKDWNIGFAYDLTVSSASEFNNTNGAFEIGIRRIFNIYKKPEVQPAILCPKF